MTICRGLLVVAMLSVAAAAVAAENLTIRYGDSVTFAQPGATAAFSISSGIAEASAVDGVVRIQAVGMGSTVVMVVVGETTVSVPVTVTPPPTAMSTALFGAGATREGTVWEASFSDSPRQVTNAFDIRRENEGEFRQLRAAIATFFSREFNQRFGVPQFAYVTTSRNRRMTLGDDSATVSLLTLRGSSVRGVHYEDDRWGFHLGYAFSAMYGGAFFTTDREYVAGVTRRFALTPSSGIAGNLYYFRNPSTIASSAANGPIASALYTSRTERLDLQAEVATGRGHVALSSLLNYDDGRQHLNADVRYRPYGMPSLGIDSQQGTFANSTYGISVSPRVNLSSSLTVANYDLPLMKQLTSTFATRASFRLPHGIGAATGENFSYFSSRTTEAVTAKTLAIPFEVSYSVAGISVAADDQPTFDLVNSRRANGYGVRLGGGKGGLRASGYYRHDVELPTLDTFLAQVPGLESALERAGVYLTDVNQIIEYLRDTAFLVNLGFASGATFNVAPARDMFGVNASWTGRRTRVDLNFLDSATELVSMTSRLRNITISAAQRITASSEVTTAASVAQTPGTGSGSSTSFFITYRHRFPEAPSLSLGFLRRGTIEGHVFRDDSGTGEYAPTLPPIAGARVLLDDRRSATTDANGYYSFANVNGGPHRLSVSLRSDRPFTFTSDSPRTAYIGKPADFGLTFFLGKVFGRIMNDAGGGIAHVAVKMEGNGISRTAETDDGGAFSFSRLPDGPYWISTVADSYPPGYAIADIPEDPIRVTAGTPVEYEILVRALRSVSGVVTRSEANGTVPLGGIEVGIPELNRKALTNAAGRYRFIDLPAGTFKIRLTANGQMYEKEAVLPAAPATISNLNFTVTAPQ